MEFEVTPGGLADLESLAPVWIAMTEHHRAVAADRWRVRPPEEAWEMRRHQHRSWLEDASGFRDCVLVDQRRRRQRGAEQLYLRQGFQPWKRTLLGRVDRGA